ncbi:hypothetical protein GCM10022237_43050 [Nocardioides ginsengisoli]|uniref:Uncharacterized protein n=1 Tax=Nocardioides ginsengisoli TaxID=363868 RepID=A0ABW3VVZ4_9ACTN
MTPAEGDPRPNDGDFRPATVFAYGDPAATAPDGPMADDLDLGDGITITLMAEGAEDVDCPLWGPQLLFSDSDEFVEFGAPRELASDIAAWAHERHVNGRSDRSDLAALKLLDRLAEAFNRRYVFVFRP